MNKSTKLEEIQFNSTTLVRTKKPVEETNASKKYTYSRGKRIIDLPV